MTDNDKTIEEAVASVLPYESWERLAGESGAAYAAFLAYRDMGLNRTIRKAVAITEPDESKREKRYRMWRNWSMAHRWKARTADWDRYTEKLKQTELRKTIEAQGEKHREITGKMLAVVEKKLDLMDPADLSAGTVTEWVGTAIRAEREAAGLAAPGAGGGNGGKQGEINFIQEFEGL